MQADFFSSAIKLFQILGRYEMEKKLTVLFMFAMFVLVVGWAITPAQAHCSGDPNHNAKHKTDPCVGAIDDITVELSGGAFVFEHGPAAVTPESEFELKGDVDVHLIRPGGAEFAPDQACITGTATDPLCIIWNGVFDLCGLLGPSDMVDVPEFFAPAGRKECVLRHV